jgi:DNA repair protein RecO
MSDIIYEHGIVLRSDISGEANRFLSILIDNDEKIKAVARGSLRVSSKLGMHLLVGDEISAGLVEGKSGLVMVSADLKRRFSQEKNLAKINFLMKICQILDDFFITNDIHAGLFKFALKTFENLSVISEKDIRIFYVYTLFQILKFAGFMPEVERCMECGQLPQAFSLTQGGALCAKHKEEKDIALSPDCWNFLKNLKQKFAVDTNLSEKDILKIQKIMDFYVQTALRELEVQK